MDTPIDANDLVDAPEGTDGSYATVATTLTGEYKNVSAFAAVVDYISASPFHENKAAETRGLPDLIW